MNCIAKYVTPQNKDGLARKAMQASIKIRDEISLGQEAPACIYSTCEILGVTVRFSKINMEGMYDRTPKPRIYLSAFRPLVRQNFNCAHELGHHVFGHGSTIDELKNEAAVSPSKLTKEFLADVFASFFLMPTIGLRQAFAAIGCSPETASPVDIFSVSSEFKVGYKTLITHLTFGLKWITKAHCKELMKTTPKNLRNELLGYETHSPLIMINQIKDTSSIDTEVGASLLLPTGVSPENSLITFEHELLEGSVFQAKQPGSCRIYSKDLKGVISVRISKKEYVGLAQYRYLEEDIDD